MLAALNRISQCDCSGQVAVCSGVEPVPAYIVEINIDAAILPEDEIANRVTLLYTVLIVVPGVQEPRKVCPEKIASTLVVPQLSRAGQREHPAESHHLVHT